MGVDREQARALSRRLSLVPAGRVIETLLAELEQAETEHEQLARSHDFWQAKAVEQADERKAAEERAEQAEAARDRLVREFKGPEVAEWAREFDAQLAAAEARAKSLEDALRKIATKEDATVPTGETGLPAHAAVFDGKVVPAVYVRKLTPQEIARAALAATGESDE